MHGEETIKTMNKPHQLVVFGFTPHKVKDVVTAMAILQAGLPVDPPAPAVVEETHPHRVKAIVTTMAVLPEDLPVDSSAPKPKTTALPRSLQKPALETAPGAPPPQSNMASEEKMDTSVQPAQSKGHKGEVKFSKAWSVDVHLHGI